MSSLKPLAQGVIADLRARRLLPVAILLAVALVAMPVLLSRSPEPVAIEATAPGDPVDTGGLPGPAEALGERALVTLASLDGSSDLEAFSARDPFKPLRTLAAIDADPAGTTTTAPDVAAGEMATEPTPGFDEGSVVGGGDPSTGEDTDDDPGGGSPAPEPEPAPKPDPTPAPFPERRFTYAVDLTFDTPGELARRYRNLPRLRMLPSEASPLLIFLGVDDTGNRATFLIDATLRPAQGGGTCSPSPEDCATLTLKPGQEQSLLDEQDQGYLLRIDQIRKVLVAATVERLQDIADLSAQRSRPTVRRFVAPVFTDLIVTGGQE